MKIIKNLKMKKLNYFLLFICVLSLNLIKAQDKKESKFNIIASGGIGYGIVENDNEPNYNLNSNNGDILLNYRINQKFGIASGIGMNELTGNGFLYNMVRIISGTLVDVGLGKIKPDEIINIINSI